LSAGERGEKGKMTDGDMERGERIRRFGTARIVEHLLLIITFLTLACTGLSQKFYFLNISQEFIIHLGGIDNVRAIHRYTGILFSILMVSHVLIATMGVLLRKWEPSMLINKKDIDDAVHNIKYYIGMENHSARCDRYNYKEKFVYWCVLTGGLPMLATGFTLWFPANVASVLPGAFIPAAKALHTNEALLIFLLIALWHVYDSIFSPDVFPLDKSIFTGYISRKRMVNEHPIELARIEGASLEEIMKAQHKDMSGEKSGT
jgi:formate dehydrogenase gamma subunit